VLEFLKKLFGGDDEIVRLGIGEIVPAVPLEVKFVPQIKHEQGDFYVVDGDCITCGAPEAAAPTLIAHQQEEYGHCYFKRQPETLEEIDQAINAVAVSCVSGLRYRGKDEKIIQKLYEIGEKNQCDTVSAINYKEVIRTKVEFTYDGAMQELLNVLVVAIPSESVNDSRIVSISSNDLDSFQFTFRWYKGLIGTIFKCSFVEQGTSVIEMSKERDGNFVSIRWSAERLNNLLLNELNASGIKWYNYDGEIKPFN
jgi:hypothetical protein